MDGEYTNMADIVAGQAPLQGVVLCCTALAQDVRTKMATVALEMGAVHKLDLTGDVTHLVVGSISTPKYRYTAKERPDITVLHPDWLEAVRVAWTSGDEVDVAALEDEYKLPTFFEVRACVTGFAEQKERDFFKATFEKHGAEYHGDLTKQVTHLVAASASSAKYQHARTWGIKIVSAKWFQESLRRGMALEEALFDPTLPEDQQGEGAYKEVADLRPSNRKRARDGEAAAGDEARKRKLRRSASTRLNGQSQDLWQDMSAREGDLKPVQADQWRDDYGHGASVTDRASMRDSVLVDRTALEGEDLDGQPSIVASEPRGLFAGAYVLIHGFDEQKIPLLTTYLAPNGATVVQSASMLEKASADPFYRQKYLIVPHNPPSELPNVPTDTAIVSEWWLERCIQHKTVYSPADDVFSRPLPTYPISGFENLIINTTGFAGLDLRQSADAIGVIGAIYEQQLGPQVSVLLSPSLTLKYEKAQYAAKHKIPAVRAEWLFDCLKSGSRLPFDDYRIKLVPYMPSQTSSPAAIETVSWKTGGSRITEDPLPQQRLSNIRKKRGISSLPLQAQEPAPAPAPALSAKKGPFILEDDDQDDDEQDDGEELPPIQIPISETLHSVPVQPQPLQERSPNASPRKSTSAKPEDRPQEAKQQSVETTPTAIGSIPALPVSPSKRPLQQNSPKDSPSSSFTRPQKELTADLASLLSKTTGTASATTATDPARRKHRPLGRNLSGSNNLRSSFSASVETSQQEAPPPPLSTQIGYETADAEAHRAQMEKRMKVDLGDGGTGRRVARVGTVRDSGADSGGRGKERRGQRGAR